ncbi:hypothetical protein A6R68_13713 [Neotoma lepida]|uniref:HMG box domain-containing protein n=1 Tax=Neotoma lepida TaxID=56216 RepID=A0A1A6H0D6_NEOLE|nr:hypothetical protein A6R68_13713 [Neotoma lepida]
MASLDKEHQWSQGDILKLLECIKNNIPSDDSRAFKKTQEDLEWGKVAFKHFSGEMCKQKWMQISHNLRKFRTLSELVLEATEHMKQPLKRKKHPDFPKRPLTAYLRFYKEQRANYCQLYPEYNNQQLTKLLAEKYNQLPEEIKERYIQDFKKEKQDFQEKLTKFKKNHPDVEHYKKSVVPRSQETKVPKKSQRDMENVKERWVEISRQWQRVPKSLKERYNCQAEELQRQYWVEMDLWLKGLSPEEYTAYREAKATCSKRKNLSMSGGRSPKFGQTDQQSTSAEELQARPGEMQGLLAPGTDSSETIRGADGGSQAFRQNMMEENNEDSSSSSDSSSTDEDEEDGHLP